MRACVCACVRACVCVCARAYDCACCMCVNVRTHAPACLHVRVRISPLHEAVQKWLDVLNQVFLSFKNILLVNVERRLVTQTLNNLV